MKMKLIATAALALFTTLGAHAISASTAVNLGALAPQTAILPYQDFGIGAFSYDFSFTTTTNETFSVGAGEALTVKFGGLSNILNSFSASIDGAAFDSATVVSRVGPFTSTSDTLTFANKGLTLASGVTHILHVQGDATVGSTLNGSLYLAAVPTAPVPEPESYAMLLAGLGAIGMVTRRRKASKR